MGESAIQNPHDGFFKQTFGRGGFAREFLSKFLREDVARCLDLAAFEAAGESFVDDELRQTQSDLVFTVPLVEGGEAVVYLLFEHKSYADRLTVFQMLKYVVRISTSGAFARGCRIAASSRWSCTTGQPAGASPAASTS